MSVRETGGMQRRDSIACVGLSVFDRASSFDPTWNGALPPALPQPQLPTLSFDFDSDNTISTSFYLTHLRHLHKCENFAVDRWMASPIPS